MTINFQLGGHSEEFIQSQLDSGQYDDAHAVVRDALRLMEEREQALALQKGALAGQIEAGYNSLHQGSHVDGDDFFAELGRELDEIDRKRS